jgi:NTP pyrophosphatase (non-canonical NTP hydrolase)/adenylate kinase family enzyme
MFDKYQKQACGTFKDHAPLTAHQARLLDWALGVGGEAGEVEEVIKHHIFGGEPLDKMKLAKEMGDVLWYLAALATTNDIDLSAIAELNINKLQHRYSSGSYSIEESAQRHEQEQAFEDTIIYKSLMAKINKTEAPLNVIIVGPDGSGKTSLCKALMPMLNAKGEVFHYQKCDYRQEDKPHLALSMLRQRTNVVYDRFYYPDDIIYSRIVHERTHDASEPMDWDTEYWKAYNQVLDELCNLNTIVVYVDADDEVLKQRSAAWADDYIKVEELGKIRALYDRWLDFLRMRPIFTMRLDTTTGAPEEHAAAVVRFVHSAQAVFSGMPEDTFLTEEEKKVAEKEDINADDGFGD